MKYEIVSNPVGMVDFSLDEGDTVTAEAGAMVYMQGRVETNTRTRKGGLLSTLKSSMLAGESFFVNEFKAKENGCTLGITGKTLGDISVIKAEEEYIIQSGAYIASTGDVTLDTKWQGLKRGLFGSDLFMLKSVGNGDIFVDGWGGIRRKDLEAGESMILDNYQLVAMPVTTEYDVGKHGGMKTTILGGEALVISITGPGSVYYQTRNLREFAMALAPLLPKRN